MLKRRTLLCLSAVALSQWACVSIDSRIAQERIDQEVVRGETEVDGGLMVIIPMVIVGHAKQLAVFRHVD